jgi:hypothetical protein
MKGRAKNNEKMEKGINGDEKKEEKRWPFSRILPH